MKISAISSVNLYNQINFGQKENKKINHASFENLKNLKVPAAAILFVMSPAANISAAEAYGDVEPSYRIETVDNSAQNSQKVISSAVESSGAYVGFDLVDSYFNDFGLHYIPVPEFGVCNIDFISTDGNNDDIEKVKLSVMQKSLDNYTDYVSPEGVSLGAVTVLGADVDEVYSDKFFVFNFYDENGELSETQYFAAGNGVHKDLGKINARTGKKLAGGSEKVFDNYAIRLSQDTFERLRKKCGDKIDCSVVDVNLNEIDGKEAFVKTFFPFANAGQ